MTEIEKAILHYSLIADKARHVKETAKELELTYMADSFSKMTVDLLKNYLTKYFEELQQLINSED